MTIASLKPFNASIFYNIIVAKDVLSTLKKNSIKSFAYEIYSTFFVLMIKNRIKKHN
jgi:hypothetical protein